MADASPHAAITRARGPAALDVMALVEQAMIRLRELAGNTWTDHNLHDPGITMLELACFALTEVAYRCTLPIEDILASPGHAVEEQFHRCRTILTNRPLTANDLRKCLIDLPGVRNAWIEADESACLYLDLDRSELSLTAPAHPRWRRFHLKGLQRVRIDFMPDHDTDAKRQQTAAQVRETLERNRNLCQDFDIVQVEEQWFALCAEVDLDSDADVTETAAMIVRAVAQILTPGVANYSLAQMLTRTCADGTPLSADSIFEGPQLLNGFIPDDELAASQLPSELRLSDVIGAVMDVAGVRSVIDLRLTPLQKRAGPSLPIDDAWRVPVKLGSIPRLSEVAGRLVLRKRGLPVGAWTLADMPDAVRTRLAALQEAARITLETGRVEDLPVAAGRSRALADYRSFQMDFPEAYGLGAVGLPGNTDDRHRAQVLQLKAYLLLFDQVLADQLATLAHAKQLLSVADTALKAIAERFQGDHPHTLATQLVTSIVDHERLYPPVGAATSPDTVLANHTESPAEATRRAHRLLDHLLARVAEDFAEYAAVMGSAFMVEPSRLVADKCRFLTDVATLGSERGLGWYQRASTADELWDSTNVSGLEQRICRLLGIADSTRRNLSADSIDVHCEVDATPGDEFRWRVKHSGTHKILLSSSTRYPAAEAAREAMAIAIERAQEPAGYERLTSVDGRFYFNIVAEDGAVIARRIEYFADAATMESAISRLITYLRERYSGEGMYLIEHLLLRPTRPEDPLWRPVCTNSSGGDCGDDPYSQRLHVVLPAYAGRFKHMEFRRFAESVIRSEVPAHLMPTVCWVDAAHLAVLEKAYREWIELHTGASSSDRAEKIQALIDALAGASNVYPQRELTECDGEDMQPHFILGQTSLGTGPSG